MSPMSFSLANLVMLGLGLVAFAVGIAFLLASRRGSEGQRYARRIGGAMAATLGAALTIFAIGLAQPQGSAR